MREFLEQLGLQSFQNQRRQGAAPGRSGGPQARLAGDSPFLPLGGGSRRWPSPRPVCSPPCRSRSGPGKIFVDWLRNQPRGHDGCAVLSARPPRRGPCRSPPFPGTSCRGPAAAISSIWRRSASGCELLSRNPWAGLAKWAAGRNNRCDGQADWRRPQSGVISPPLEGFCGPPEGELCESIKA